MTADEAREHIRYSGWASRRLLDAALKLAPGDLHRDMSVSHKSVSDTLAHIHMADRVWLARVLGTPMTQPAAALEVEWPKIQKGWEAWADSLDDAGTARIVSYKDSKGAAHSPVWQIVLHVVNHATMHRGQAMAMLRQLGVAPPPTDLMIYFGEQR